MLELCSVTPDTSLPTEQQGRAAHLCQPRKLHPKIRGAMALQVAGVAV